jgi:excisionase family DNA binding protein
VLRLWAEDGSAPAPRLDPRRRQPRQKAQTSEQAASPGETKPGNIGELVLLLSIEDAGKALGVGRSTVYELIGSGDLELVHIGRSARVPVEAVQAFVARLRRQADSRGGSETARRSGETAVPAPGHRAKPVGSMGARTGGVGS